MINLVCWECGNSLFFLQRSRRGEERTVDRASGTLRCGEWVPDVSPSSTAAPGIRCAECGARVDEMPKELVDQRTEVLDPAAVDVAALTEGIARILDGWSVTTVGLPARPARTVPIPDSLLHPAIASRLRDRTGGALFSHQRLATEAALRGENTIQVTSAGSGKTLGFMIPVLQQLVSRPTSTALLVYPSVSLIGDQLIGLRAWAHEIRDVADGAYDLRLGAGTEWIRVGRYDGMADEITRSRVRASGRIVLTTPDSLHSAMLRFALHEYADRTSWSRFYRGLGSVVVDELHQYAGAFGSATSMVFRRLRRVAEHHGGRPTFHMASATIGNAGEVARTLSGLNDFTLIDRDGSPRSERVILVGANDHDGTVGDVVVAAVGAALGHPGDARPPVRALTFARSRLGVDLLAEQIRSSLGARGWERLGELVTAYKGTLDSDARAAADANLRDGTALAIVSTNALELGIDVPSLGLAILDGLPPSAASFEQRAGRVGRAGPGLVLLLLGDTPLDRYFAQDPERLREWLDGVRPQLAIDSENPEVVRLYGLVPAQEELHGVCAEDEAWFGREHVDRWLAGAVGAPTGKVGTRLYFTVELGSGEPYAGLRSSGLTELFDIREVATSGEPGRRLGRVDRLTAMTEAYVGAVWRDGAGSTFEIEHVDLADSRINAVRVPAESSWTRGILEVAVEPLDDLLPVLRRDNTAVRYTTLRVTYTCHRQRVARGGQARWEPVESPWPPLHAVTSGLRVDVDRAWFSDGDHEATLRGAANALAVVAPTITICSPADIRHTTRGRTIYVHDAAGTFGWTKPLYERLVEYAAFAWQVASTCACDSDGCPSCVLGRDGQEVSRRGAAALLHRLATCWVT